MINNLNNVVNNFRGNVISSQLDETISDVVHNANINDVTTEVSSEWSLVSLCSFQDQQTLDYRFAKAIAEKNSSHQESLIQLLTDLNEWSDDNPDSNCIQLKGLNEPLYSRTVDTLNSISVLTEDVNYIRIVNAGPAQVLIVEIHFDEIYQPFYTGPSNSSLAGFSVDQLIEAISVMVMATSDLSTVWSTIANMAGEILNSGSGLMSFETISRGVADSTSPRLKQFFSSLSQFLTVSGDVNSSVVHSIIAAESGIALSDEGTKVNFSDELPYISNSCGLVLGEVFRTIGAAVTAAITLISPIVGFVLGALTAAVSAFADTINSVAANIGDAVATIDPKASDYTLPQFLCRLVISTNELKTILGYTTIIPDDCKMLKLINSVSTSIIIKTNSDEWILYLFINAMYCAPVDRVGATMYHFDSGSATYVVKEVQAINAVWSDVNQNIPSSPDWYNDPSKVQYISIGLPEALVSTSNSFYLYHFNFNQAAITGNRHVHLMGAINSAIPQASTSTEFDSEINTDNYTLFTAQSFSEFINARADRINDGTLALVPIESDVNSGYFKFSARVQDGSDPSITTIYSNSDLNLASAYGYPEDAICAKNSFAEAGEQFIDQIKQTTLAVRAVEQSLASLLCIFLQSREENDSSETWSHVACTSIINVYDKNYQLEQDDFSTASLESLTHEMGVFLYNYRFKPIYANPNIDATERLKDIFDHVIPAVRAYIEAMPSATARRTFTNNFLWRLYGYYNVNRLPDSSMIYYQAGGSSQKFLDRKAHCSWICISNPKRSAGVFFTPPSRTVSSVRGAVKALGLIAVASAVVVATTTVLVKRAVQNWQVRKSKQLQAAYAALPVNGSAREYAAYAKQLRRANFVAGVLGLPAYGATGVPILVGSSGSSSNLNSDYGSALQDIINSIRG